MGAKKSRRESTKKSQNSKTHGAELGRALDWVLDGDIFDNVALHGNVSWTAKALVRVAVFWVWHPDSSLVAAANGAIAIVAQIFGGGTINSYQTLTNGLVAYSHLLLPVLWIRLHGLMEGCEKESWRVGLWLALAVDGSRVGVPRTRKNEQRFCKPSKRKKSKRKGNKRGRHANRKQTNVRKKKHYDPQPVGPQMWLTLVWHIGQRLPWCWKIGPSYSSERAHFLEILYELEFPKNTLFCGDAGFVGYDFWRGIRDNDHHFLVRVGGNVRLLKKLGYVRERNGIVYCWPAEAMKKKLSPLVLRLLQFKDRRGGNVYLVTNVLKDKDLTLRQASEIYRRRWGIELQFRSFKQTFQRSKLRSRTPDRAEIELHWSLIGLWVIQLLAFKEQRKSTEPLEQTSVAAAIRIIRDIMHNRANVPPKGQSLANQLADATTDTYTRHSKKKSRNYPRRKEEPSTSKPIVQIAKAEHKRKLREIQDLATAS